MHIQSLGPEHPLEEDKVTHSSTLAWRILWTEDPGGLQSIGSQRGGHDWSDSVRMHVLYLSILNRKEWFCLLRWIGVSWTKTPRASVPFCIKGGLAPRAQELGLHSSGWVLPGEEAGMGVQAVPCTRHLGRGGQHPACCLPSRGPRVGREGHCMVALPRGGAFSD